MRRVLFIVLAVAFAATPLFAAVMTVEGELVDHACFTGKGATAGAGAAHASCAQACAKKGQAVALVAADGAVYMLSGELTAENNAKLVPHMSHKVALTGDVTEKDGVKTIAVAATGLKMVSR